MRHLDLLSAMVTSQLRNLSMRWADMSKISLLTFKRYLSNPESCGSYIVLRPIPEKVASYQIRMQISVVNHQVPASPFTRCLVTGKSVRLLVPQLFFYKVGVLTYTFLLELSELKEGKHKSESLWWRVFVDCGVVETGYGPRHLISTLPPP